MKNIINNWLDKNGTKEINKEVKMEAKRYNKLISDFENMEGIIHSMFDAKDWIRFERFVERQEKENQEDLNNKDNWEFERSSGYAGYRNEVTGDWIYEKHYLEKFAEKDNYNGKLEIKWISDNIQCKQVESCYNSLSKKCVCPKEEWISPMQKFKIRGKELTTEEVMEGRSSAYSFLDFYSPKKETLEKIKFVLSANNEAQAIRFIEQYGEWVKENCLKEFKTEIDKISLSNENINSWGDWFEYAIKEVNKYLKNK